MGNAVFPTFPGLKWGRKKTPVWSTQVKKSASGREVRAGFYSYPQWRFSLSFEVLRTKTAISELEQLAGFFNARRGSLESFLYEDPADNTVTDQFVANVQHGITDYQLVRSFGGFVEPVLAVKGEPVIKVNGVVKRKTADYEISENGTLRFTRIQTTGARITWSGNFYFRVRFAHDTADFENILGHLWNAKKIEFLSVKL